MISDLFSLFSFTFCPESQDFKEGLKSGILLAYTVTKSAETDNLKHVPYGDTVSVKLYIVF